MSQERADEHNDNELMKEEELAVTDGGEAMLKPVDVKTGEEDEDVIFRKRAKIFRFDDGENQWKERGQGEARILQHKEHKTHYRFLLRRDGTLKLGANHFLISGMTLKKNSADDKSWVWATAADVSDEEPQPEVFAIRFQTPEMAAEFKTVFDECCAKAKYD
eukprot:PhM_4_TR2777/c0_g1_i1/m.713/K15306/RANBP1; Ran-binding protein 1